VVVDGKRRHFQFNEIAFPDDSGYFGYAVEQTDLKEIAKELKQSERANSELLNSSSSAMAIYGKDMRLNHYNTAFVDLWSLEEKWLDNKPTYLEVLELLRQERKMPEQADYNKFRNEQISLFKDLIEPRDEYYYLPDGKTLRVIAVPHAQGGVLFAYEDLTDRLSMERSYNTLIAVQKETLDNLSEAVITLGEDGNVQLYNPKYVELWPDSERLLRKNPHVSELIEHSKELLEKDGQEWDKTKERFVSQSTERILTTIRIERTDGKLIDRTAIPLPDGATLISYVDVTDSTLLERSLRERNEALEGADRIKTDFLASVSYELRTPLTSILGLTEILEKQFFGKLNEQQGGYVKDIQVASSELLVLINDVLDMASIEAGYLSLDKADCDIKRLLESLADTLEEKSKEKELKLTIECEGGIGLIKADRRRLKQAILNIFNNVFKFSVQGGHLQVRAYSNNESVVIMIKDEHVESSDKELAQILKRFHRVMGEKSGSGLGLAVAKNIEELHQGSISLEAAGKGVAVCCKFQPIHKKSTSEAA
jgi:signal transduction histidine kinase